VNAPGSRAEGSINVSTPHARAEAGLGKRVTAAWERLHGVPGGRWLFSRLLARMVPYSGTIGATVLELEPGRAVLEVRERRRVRNHLRSVHAIALANLGELASGLAALLAMPPGVRGIPVRIEIDYFKKARGTLRAEGVADLPEVDVPTNTIVSADIRNADGELVAQVRVRWTLERV
jgi:acyl-coenzyme A thioesterase PaaI-like protein